MAAFALLIWPVIALIMFARMTAIPALIWCSLLPHLFLPEAFVIPLPGLPDLDKTSIIVYSLFLGFFLNRQKFRLELSRNPRSLGDPRLKRLITLCLVLAFGGIIATVLGNGDALRYGDRFLPGLRAWDVISLTADLFFLIGPLFLARSYLARPESHRTLLRAFVIMGLLYTFLMLIELRLSPQLHNWLYGYHQHSFLQHIRGGYRPKVFLQHGIVVGFFMFMSTIAALSMWKATRETKWLLATIWLFMILTVSKNLAAFLITTLFIILLTVTTSRIQKTVMVTIAAVVLFYPALRQAQLIPLEQIMSAAHSISEDRAQSLQYRLDNEDQFLSKAQERLIAGWGSFGRERIYDDTGRDLSTSDGRWIQIISTRGWIGYIGLFGILTLPVFFLWRTSRRKDIPIETMGLATIVTGNLIYMIPNSTLTAIGWLVFGGLIGFLQFDSQANAQTDNVKSGSASTPRLAKNKYTRFSQRQNRLRTGSASR